MNKARGLIKPGWFPEHEGGYPPLTLLVHTEQNAQYWTLWAHIVRINAEDDKPRNLTGHPATDIGIRAQAARDGLDPGRIYGYRLCKQGYSIDDLENLEDAVKAIKTISRRVSKTAVLDGSAEPMTFTKYFVAVAQAIGADEIWFYDDRKGWYTDSTFVRLGIREAAARIEREAKEAVK